MNADLEAARALVKHYSHERRTRAVEKQDSDLCCLCVKIRVLVKIIGSKDMENWKPAPVKPVVGIDVLQQIDIRVGRIVSVDDVAGSSKLLKLTVHFGDHTRTILAGMKKERANP